jgi:hypothetical protein
MTMAWQDFEILVRDLGPRRTVPSSLATLAAVRCLPCQAHRWATDTIRVAADFA